MRTGGTLETTPSSVAPPPVRPVPPPLQLKPLFSPPPAAATIKPTPWHSPIPYLFGGIAAMLGLIAVALLLLACSYWKLSGQTSTVADGGHGDERTGGAPVELPLPDLEEKIVVIMAGDVKPTFLATPLFPPNRNSPLAEENTGKGYQNQGKETDQNSKLQIIHHFEQRTAENSRYIHREVQEITLQGQELNQ